MLHVEKVPDHSIWEDVADGLLTAQHKLYNDTADELAKSGARKHAVPTPLVLSTRRRKRIAALIQRRAVAILEERAPPLEKKVKEDAFTDHNLRVSQQNLPVRLELPVALG